VSASPSRTFWIDGRLVSSQEAYAPALAHGLHYGTSVFEGIRAYPTARGPSIFRLNEHLDRLFASARAYGLEIGYSLEALRAAVLETLQTSGLVDAYIRPLAYFGDESIALAPRLRCSTHVLIAVFAFPPLMGEAPGARTTISPVRKFSSLAMPSTVKAGGHYTNSVLALQDAVARGFDEAILLNDRGDVAEGSGENIFLVRGGTLHTNDASADVLYGITRDSVLHIARDEGIPCSIGPISREDLLRADEAFFTGTAAEVVPILCVDEHVFPNERPVTERLRDIYARAVRGTEPRYERWLTLANADEVRASARA